ncbi:hypothetical protein L2E82_19563 [Cichorium intybus]|uniref:Uncharacterized protein n=1 Tax=Cichorium intybus TaxID=13427 RepID=A0ACB9FCT4_CICIN|nr:hypothetical protein L2E82_19563 [Cichorium intybus]
MIVYGFFLVSLFIYWLTRNNGSKLQPPLPPGPKPLPFIGCIINMLRNKPTFRWIHRLMDEMKTKIICIRLGNIHVIAVSDPIIACKFLKDKDAIFSSRPDCMSGFLTSGGYLSTVLVPMSDHWKIMRKTLATNILSLDKHKWLQDKRDREADNLLRYIYKRCHIDAAVTRGVVNVRTVVQQYSSNVIRNIMFGSRYFGKGNADGGPGDEEIEHVDSLLTVLGHLYAFCVTDYFPWLRWITDFDGHEKIIRNAIYTARKHQDRLVDERIQEWKDGVRTKEDDLLDVFINLKNPRLTGNQIKAQIFELILATFDNPANEVVLTDHNLQMLSFSTGRRGCAGVLLGSTMTVMLLARLLQGFTWELPPGESYVDLKENIQDLMKANPLLALVKPRLSHHLYPTY